MSEPLNTVALGDPPAFPDHLDHWALTGQWTDQPRAFVNGYQGWTMVVGPNADGFPATMNGCNGGRFLVRWRALDDGANVVAAAGVPNEQGSIEGEPVAQADGHSGWMDLDGCQAPVFRMSSAMPDGQNLEDVTVEVQSYRPAV